MKRIGRKNRAEAMNGWWEKAHDYVLPGFSVSKAILLTGAAARL